MAGQVQLNIRITVFFTVGGRRGAIENPYHSFSFLTIDGRRGLIKYPCHGFFLQYVAGEVQLKIRTIVFLF